MRAEVLEKKFAEVMRERQMQPGTVCNWVLDEDSVGPMIEHVQYEELLKLLPDKVVQNMERSRLARDGRIPMLRNGFGYVNCLGSIIADGTAIASSSAEARLVPATLLLPNFWQPEGSTARTVRGQLRGRQTTLTTAATMIFRIRGEATDVITGTAWGATGAITQDTTIQTATMWELEFHIVARLVGTAGTVFCMGDADMATAALTIANQQNKFMGSAGSATPAAVTKDMTTNTFLNVTGQWSLATAYSIQAHQFTLEALN